VIEGEFGRVRVRAEVGRVMLARSGHMYFDLKDERAVLSASSADRFRLRRAIFAGHALDAWYGKPNHRIRHP